ncbi:8781_t:CDS:2 [Diversispora eburnea]|uniref:8781_t:CDS:1 n=1 Tax=Diversispora eburnea TaxID=1213867 RepID=A0A9N8ZFV6_9GLOM|nr:8781_t:CDS:2 [Diversispora eburnea]
MNTNEKLQPYIRRSQLGRDQIIQQQQPAVRNGTKMAILKWIIIMEMLIKKNKRLIQQQYEHWTNDPIRQ